MGRSIESVRQGVGDIARRWERAGRALGKDDRPYATRLAMMARAHAGEGFYAFDDPLEAAVFSVLIELLKDRDQSMERLAPGPGIQFGDGDAPVDRNVDP